VAFRPQPSREWDTSRRSKYTSAPKTVQPTSREARSWPCTLLCGAIRR
jgi:hypothetical protein